MSDHQPNMVNKRHSPGSEKENEDRHRPWKEITNDLRHGELDKINRINKQNTSQVRLKAVQISR